ncbi:MAG: hypothetical protein EBY06_07265 [Burkholderiaceae bacterium]|nr:hypothetical protein [Burkholderiaceae bacterium]
MIVYLHGFRSSPNSSKAQLTKDAIASLVEKGKSIHWYCPQLPPSPGEASTRSSLRCGQSRATSRRRGRRPSRWRASSIPCISIGWFTSPAISTN